MWLKSSGKWVESGWQSLREGGRGGAGGALDQMQLSVC